MSADSRHSSPFPTDEVDPSILQQIAQPTWGEHIPAPVTEETPPDALPPVPEWDSSRPVLSAGFVEDFTVDPIQQRHGLPPLPTEAAPPVTHDRLLTDVLVQSVPSGRLTVVESVTYEQVGRELVSVGGAFDFVLVGDEQIYRRELRVGPAWQPLDTGWLGAKVSHVVIRNAGDPKRGDQSVRVGFGTGKAPDTVWAIEIPPGQSCRFMPAFTSRVWLSVSPTHTTDPMKYASVHVTAVPS